MTTEPSTVADTIAWARPEDVGMSRERLLRIGERLEEDIAGGTLPGAVALVGRRGRIVHFKAYGARDPEAPDPMQLDTIFRIYSMTKPIVSLAVMMLVEEGRLDLDDPLSRVLPAFANVKVASVTDTGLTRVAATTPITILDLLRHTSGLTYEWIQEGPVGELYAAVQSGRRDRTNAEQMAVLADLPLLVQPGTRWEYSRSTDVLGHVIELVSGRTLAEFLSERIFAPLGMLETGFHVPDEYAGRLAEALRVDPDTGEAVSLMDVRTKVAMQSGGGGLASTAGDYARFLHMVASGGTLDGMRLVSPATIDLMLADHLAPHMTSQAFLPAGYGFGLGFAIRRGDGVAPFPGTAGDAYWEGLGGTSFWIDRARQLYAVLMIQAPGRRKHYRHLFRQLVYAAVTE